MSGSVPMKNSNSNLNRRTPDVEINNTEAKETEQNESANAKETANLVIKHSDDLLNELLHIPPSNTTTSDTKIGKNNDSNKVVHENATEFLKPEEQVNKSPFLDPLVIEPEERDIEVTQPFESAETTCIQRDTERQEGHASNEDEANASKARAYRYLMFKVPQPVNHTLKQRLLEVSLNARQCLDDGECPGDDKSTESEQSAVEQTVENAVDVDANRTTSRLSLRIRLFDELGTFNFSKAATEAKIDVENVIQSLLNKVALENSKTMMGTKTHLCCEPFEEAITLSDLEGLDTNINPILRFPKNLDVPLIDTRKTTQQDFRNTCKIEYCDKRVDDDSNNLRESENAAKDLKIQTLVEKVADQTPSKESKLLIKEVFQSMEIVSSSDNIKTVISKPVNEYDISVGFEKSGITTLAPQEISGVGFTVPPQKSFKHGSNIMFKSSINITKVTNNQNLDNALDIFERKKSLEILEPYTESQTQTGNKNDFDQAGEENIKTYTESQLLIKEVLQPFDNAVSVEDSVRYSGNLLKDQTEDYNKSVEEILHPINQTLPYSQAIIGSVKVQSLNYSVKSDVKIIRESASLLRGIRLPLDNTDNFKVKTVTERSNTSLNESGASEHRLGEIDAAIDSHINQIFNKEPTVNTNETKIELVIEKSNHVLTPIPSNIGKSKLSESVIASEIIVMDTALIESQESLRVPPPSSITPENERHNSKGTPNIEPKHIELQLKILQRHSDVSTKNELKTATEQQNMENVTQYSSSFPFRLQSAPLLQLFDYTVNARPPDRPFNRKSQQRLHQPCACEVEVTDTVSHEQSGLGTLLRLASDNPLENESRLCTVQMATDCQTSQTTSGESHLGVKVIQAQKWNEVASSKERFRLQMPRKYDIYPKAEESQGLKSCSSSVPVKTAASKVSFSVPLRCRVSKYSQEFATKKFPSTSDSFRIKLPSYDAEVQVGRSLVEVQKTISPLNLRRRHSKTTPFQDMLFINSEDDALVAKIQDTRSPKMKTKKSRDKENLRILDSRERLAKSEDNVTSKKKATTSSKPAKSASQTSASTSAHKKSRFKDWTSPIKSFFSSSFNFFRRKLRKDTTDKCKDKDAQGPSGIKKQKDNHGKTVCINSSVNNYAFVL